MEEWEFFKTTKFDPIFRNSNQSQFLTTPLQISCVEVPRQSSNGALNSISDLFDLMAAGKVQLSPKCVWRYKHVYVHPI